MKSTNQLEQGNLPAVVVISYRLPFSLQQLLTRLTSISDSQAEILLLCTAGNDSTTKHRLANFNIPQGIKIHITSNSMSIGEARTLSLCLVQAPYIAFLDDDSMPHDNWWNTLLSACNNPANPALIFGPREPDEGHGLGTLVRKFETRNSRKHLHQGTEPVTIGTSSSWNYMCAGGNMAVCRSVLSNVPITAEKFKKIAFEDVDFQIRLIKQSKLVMFFPTMRVDHFHPLSCYELLNKSKLSGQGMAHCTYAHDALFKQLSRWSLQRLLFSVLWRLGWLPFVAIFPYILILLIPVLLIVFRTSKNHGFTGLLAWWIVKGVRDFAIIYYYSLEIFKLKIQQGTSNNCLIAKMNHAISDNSQ
jgi:GT2 family glycosyltransferase